MPKYENLTQEIFDALLLDIVKGMTAQELLAIPSVKYTLSEALDSEVIAEWINQQEDA